ncbi:MAG: phosphoribosylglycinamide formyltransferase [Bryobacteraceae bacterium]|nr:phosphoribosylglycinamide formyltransferase [Bryobacteraceae bacterium]
MNRLGILLSGRGSNFEAIAKNCASGALPAEIAVVISNVPEAKGLETARSMGLATSSLPSKGAERQDYDRQLASILRERRVDLVCLAGFMRLITHELLTEFPQKILNIHPSLLPAFPGLHAQRQALDYGVKVSGCTVHFVDEGLDSGPIIAQSAVAVLESDTEQTLSERILVQEHLLYSEAIREVLAGRITYRKRRVS